MSGEYESEIKENMEVVVRETPTNNIKEYEVILNTAQSNVAEHYCNIVGILKAIIISNIEPMDIVINSNSGWQLYEETQRQGVHYFPLKATALNYKGKQFNYVAEDYYLNDGLHIVVKGAKNSNIKIVFRYI